VEKIALARSIPFSLCFCSKRSPGRATTKEWENKKRGKQQQTHDSFTVGAINGIQRTHTQYPQRGRAALGEEAERHNVLCGWSARRIIYERDALTPNVTKSIPKQQQCALPRNSLRNFSRGRTRIDLRRGKCSNRGELGDNLTGNVVLSQHTEGAPWRLRVLDFSAGAKVQTRA